MEEGGEGGWGREGRGGRVEEGGGRGGRVEEGGRVEGMSLMLCMFINLFPLFILIIFNWFLLPYEHILLSTLTLL